MKEKLVEEMWNDAIRRILIYTAVGVALRLISTFILGWGLYGYVTILLAQFGACMGVYAKTYQVTKSLK